MVFLPPCVNLGSWREDLTCGGGVNTDRRNRALLPEHEFLVTAFGYLVGRPPEMRAVAVVAQYSAHGPAFDVAVHASLPGIDLRGQQSLTRLDHDPRPLVHLVRPGLHALVVVPLHEPQHARLEFDAVRDGLWNIAARGVRAQLPFSMLGKPSASMPR